MSLPARITIEIILALVARGPADDADVAAVAVADARADAARALRQPRVTAELRAGVAPGGLVRLPGTDLWVAGSPGLDDLAVQGRYGAEVAVDQTVLDFGQTSARIAAADHARAAARHDRDAARRARERDAGDAFYRWAAAAAVAAVAHDDAEAAREVRWQVRHRIDKGVLAPADGDAAEAEHLRAQLAARRADADAAAARAALEVLVGALPADAVPVVAAPPAPPATTTADPERAAAMARLDAARADLDAAARARRPTVGVTAGLGVRGVDDHLLPSWQVGVALRVPLFDRGTDAARAEAEARTRQLSARVRQLDELRAATARATAAAASTAEERAALAAELVAHAERAAARAEADAGRRGDPADPLIRAHSDLRRARLEQTLAAIDLAAATFRAAH